MVVTTTRRRSSPVTTAHAAEPAPAVPPMPERTPKALHEAIARHTPQLLPDFDEHWKRAIADTYDIGPLPAFLARWWVEYALARDSELDAHADDLHRRAAEATDYAVAKALLEEVSDIRYGARELDSPQTGRRGCVRVQTGGGRASPGGTRSERSG